jgi:hypothetical protein
MNVDPLLLSIILAAPLLLSILLRKDFLFMWVQFTMNTLFELFAKDLSETNYFTMATLANVVIALVALRTSHMYALAYAVYATFTYLRMDEYIGYSGGYFAILSNILLCLILITRFIRNNNKG